MNCEKSPLPMRSALTCFSLAMVALLPAACGPGGSNVSFAAGAASADAGQPSTDLVFGGISTADAINPNEITLSWQPAILASTGSGASQMRYHVYRGLTEELAKQESGFVATTDQGVDSFIDSGLPDSTTIFYRVVAMDAEERTSITTEVASAHTPSAYGAGSIDYTADILPLWSTTMPGDANTDCLSCHTTPGAGMLDLSTLEGVLAGVGTLGSPDSFVIPYQGEASWSEFLARMSVWPNFFQHSAYFAEPTGLAAMEVPLMAWIAEGALAVPDSAPPVFEFGDSEIAGRYFGEFTAFDTVQVTYPHAVDPESLPFNGSRAGQLEYAIYAGVDSNSINWDKPVAIGLVELANENDPTVSTSFEWLESDSLIVVVRPMDASGRSVSFDFENYDPETASAAEITSFHNRMRNQSTNEREMFIQR
jgi:hypothetical protein